jgi:hypothetical protein
MKTVVPEFAEKPRGGWFSFLAMAGEEFHGPVTAALAAAVVLVLLVMLRPVDAFPLWLMAAPALAFLAAALWGWAVSYRRLQALEDYPLSRIASAPQGYVGLEGRAASFPGKPLQSPLSQLPCCWYSYEVVERADGDRGETTQESDTSEWSFMMNDGSGECVVDPVGAKLVSVRVRKWREGNFHYSERLIIPGDPLFVLGRFATTGSMMAEGDIEFSVGQRLAEWKKDMPALIRRFAAGEAGGPGGRFSEQAWERVRLQARRDIEAELAANPPQPQNIVSQPADGRPFIISAESRRRLQRDMTIWACIHLSCFLLGVAALAALAFRP